MEDYKSEAGEILSRFLHHQLKSPECVAALNAALSELIPKLRPDQLPELRAMMLVNKERVLKEMEKRESWSVAVKRAKAAKREPMLKAGRLALKPGPHDTALVFLSK